MLNVRSTLGWLRGSRYSDFNFNVPQEETGINFDLSLQIKFKSSYNKQAVLLNCSYDMILKVMHWSLYVTDVVVEAFFQAKTAV